MRVEEADEVHQATHGPLPSALRDTTESSIPQPRVVGSADALETRPANGRAVPRCKTTEPGVAGRPSSALKETVSLPGGKESSEKGGMDSEPPGQARITTLETEIQACKREQRRLRAEYEVEVRNCADLRDALEARERELASAKAPLQEQLQEAREALAQADCAETRALMRIEDDLAQFVRLADSKDCKIHELDQRLHGARQDYQRFLRDGPPKDTAVEEALRAVEKEATDLLSGIQRTEQIIASLHGDLKHSLEYMMAANIEAAGGPSPDLGLEDFLPGTVREHLGLSEHGTAHLKTLYNKYQLIMIEIQQRELSSGTPITPIQEGVENSCSDHSTTASGRHVAAHTSIEKTLDSSRRSSLADEHPLEVSVQSGRYRPPKEVLEEVSPNLMVPTPPLETPQSAGNVSAPMTPVFNSIWAQPQKAEVSQVPETVPLAVATLGEGDDFWGTGEESPPFSRSHPVGRTLPQGALPSTSLEEESCVMREAIVQELRQLSEALESPIDLVPSHAEVIVEVRAGRELRRAAAQGDEGAVKVWLPQATSAHMDDSIFLGWTVWHVAAAYGHCGVLECLKEDMLRRETHHHVTLDCRTRAGLSALGVACIAGRVEAARSLILGMAPVDVQDSRGNTPLLWAAFGGQARALVPMLLNVRADPEVANISGQRPAISGLLAGCSISTLTRPDNAAAGSARAAVEFVPGSSARCGGAGLLPNEHLGEAYHCIRTMGAEPPATPGLLSYTLEMFTAAVRDAVGFGRSSKARRLAQLSAAEADSEVWSAWVSNYTHAGLHAAVDVGRQHADPLLADHNQQAIVLTAERLLLFNARSWSLMQAIPLSELSELKTSSFSSSVLILRAHGLPDVVLDVPVSVHGCFLEELQKAVSNLAAKWGGGDFGGNVRIQHECEPIVELLDERRRRVGTLAYVEAHVFLLLPYAPASLLLAGEDTFIFGLLDVYQGSTAAWGAPAGAIWLGWKWQTYLWILKGGSWEGRKLVWCQHPNDARCLGSVLVRRLFAVEPLDTPQGEACLTIDYGADEDTHSLTLRASSAQNRDDWILALRTIQTRM